MYIFIQYILIISLPWTLPRSSLPIVIQIYILSFPFKKTNSHLNNKNNIKNKVKQNQTDWKKKIKQVVEKESK